MGPQQQQHNDHASASVGYDPIANDVFISEPFPLKLHKMIEFAEQNELSHIISWNQEGTSFRVHSPLEFEETIMEIFFRQSKYKSFMRQLHLYSFIRTWDNTATSLKGSYHHKNFVRANKSLARFIFRKNRKPVKSPGNVGRLKIIAKANVHAAEAILSSIQEQKKHESLVDSVKSMSVQQQQEAPLLSDNAMMIDDIDSIDNITNEGDDPEELYKPVDPDEIFAEDAIGPKRVSFTQNDFQMAFATGLMDSNNVSWMKTQMVPSASSPHSATSLFSFMHNDMRRGNINLPSTQ